MVEAVDSLPSQQLSTTRRSLRKAVKNIAVRAYTVRSSAFPGFSCVVRDSRRVGFHDNSLSCNKNPNFTEKFEVRTTTLPLLQQEPQLHREVRGKNNPQSKQAKNLFTFMPFQLLLLPSSCTTFWGWVGHPKVLLLD